MANPNQKIVEDAWLRLWNEAKYPNYYLPTAILDGIKANGITVSPLGDLDLPQLGPFAMFSEPVIGSISLEFDNNVINGLQTMSNQGINVTADGLSFTATVGVQALSSSGDFKVNAAGLSVCAVDSVWLIGQIFDSDGAPPPDPDNDPGIQQAKSYRAKLLAQGENGRAMVGAYYDNNDVYNTVANDKGSAFNYNWPYYKTSGNDQHGNPVTVDSRILSSQTTDAAENPTDPDKVVGYNAYSLHSWTGQGLMISSLSYEIDKLLAPYQSKPVPPAVQAQVDKLTEAQLATFKFTDQAKRVDGAHPNGMTVDSVMTVVKTAEPQEASESAEVYASTKSLVAVAEGANGGNEAFRMGLIRAHELAVAFYASPEREARVKAQDSTPVHGTYSLSVPVPTMSISGTIGIDGGKLSVTITNVSSSSPSLTYNLEPADGGSDLFKKIVDHYISAEYIHQLCQQKANDALNSDKLKAYMTDRINQSINQIFG